MMHQMIFMTAALALVSSDAGAAPYIPTLTGDQFVSAVAHTEAKSAFDVVQREKAFSYLDGVRDGAEGVAWCDVSQRKTPDLAEDLAGEIAKLPAAERKGNAAPLIRKLLGKRLPCPAKGGTP